jgi:hypothetical protein
MLRCDTDTAYASPVWQTVGEASEVWDIVAGNPDLCSTFYTIPGPASPEAAAALDWVGDRVFETFPLTLTALAEEHALLGLFHELGKMRGGRRWMEVSADGLADLVEECAARLSSELAGVALYEYRRWREIRAQPAACLQDRMLLRGLDLEVVSQAAPNTNPPLEEPALPGRQRPNTE